jgi:hypothetical protein
LSTIPENLVGRLVRILVRPFAGQCGIVTAVKVSRGKAGPALTEFRVEFAKPAKAARIGHVVACWLSRSEFSTQLEAPAPAVSGNETADAL